MHRLSKPCPALVAAFQADHPLRDRQRLQEFSTSVMLVGYSAFSDKAQATHLAEIRNHAVLREE